MWTTRFVMLVALIAMSGKVGAEPLTDVLRTMVAAPAATDQSDLAAHLETSGHWSFANRSAERYIASGAAEVQRAIDTLAPSSRLPGHRLVLHLSQPTLHAPTVELAALPKRTVVRALVDGHSIPVALQPNARPLLMITPGVALIADTDRAFLAAHRHLTRRIPALGMRVLAVEPGAPRILSSSPRVDLQTKQTLVDSIDPAAVVDALSGAPRQTVLIKGRIDGDMVWTRGKSGGEMHVMLSALEAAAAANDVTLFVHGSTAAQPGGRNWLWLPVFDKVAAAGSAPRLVDLIATVSENASLVISAEVMSGASNGGRVRLVARPVETETGRSSAEVWLRRIGDAAKDLLGAETPRILVVSLPSVERHDELSRRLIGWLPSTIQFVYAGLLVVGLVGWPTARRWFDSVWPTEISADYAGRAGHMAARAVRAAIFTVIFVPLVAVMALPVQVTRWLSRAHGATKR